MFRKKILLTVVTFGIFGFLAGGSSDDKKSTTTNTEKSIEKKLDPRIESLEQERKFSTKIGTLGSGEISDELSAFGGKSLSRQTREEAENWQKLQLEKNNFVGLKVKDWECTYWGDKAILKDKVSCVSPYYVFDSNDKYGSAGKVWFDLIIDRSKVNDMTIFEKDEFVFSGEVSEVTYAKLRGTIPPSIDTNLVTVKNVELSIKKK